MNWNPALQITVLRKEEINQFEKYSPRLTMKTQLNPSKWESEATTELTDRKRKA